MPKNNLGKIGEDIALKFLKQKSYCFLDRNVASRFGEIDLVLRDKKTIVFVEVKTRLSQAYGSPLQAITRRKITTLIKTMQWYLMVNRQHSASYRLDAVAVELDNLGNIKDIKHLKNITG